MSATTDNTGFTASLHLSVGNNMASAITRYGFREAIEKKYDNIFMGLEVVWDSEEFKVE